MGSNSISNNSNNIRVNSNYTNKKYGSTIGKSGGSSQAALASRARTAKTEEFDLSSPTVIAQKENMVKKSEVTKQIETVISYLDNTKNTLEEQKEGLLNKSRSFAVSANRGQYPELYYEENTKGAKKYLNPAEAIKSDKYFKKYLKENGYPTDKERMSADKYSLLKQQYTNYINTVYTEKYNKCFSEALGMTYAEYREKLTQLNNDIESIKASKYELTQQAKEQPYIELMDTDDFQNYISNNKNNPNSELYKLYEIKNGTVSLNNDSYWRFEYFTEQDMLIFSYLWDTQSPKVAREYVEAIEDKLNKAEGQANAEKFLDSLRDENGNIDADVWAGVLSGAKGFENGLSTFFEGLGNVFSGEGMMSTSQYEQMYILSELTNSAGNYISKIVNEISEKQGQEAAADFASKIYNTDTGEINLEYAKSVLSVQEYNNLVIKINTDKKSILDNVYELSSSAGNMLPSMIVSLAVSAVATPAAGSVVGSTLMGISAGGNSKNQALVQGNDLLASTMYGVFSGVSETTLGLLLGNIPGLNQGASLSLKGLFKEGLEEMLQEYVDAGLRASILGETIDITQLNKDAVKSFIYGAVMSGIMNGGQVAFTAVTSVGLVKINNLSEAISFAKENGIDIDSLPSEGVKTEIQQSSNNPAPTQSAINESVQSSSINPRYSDIDGQIAMANNNTRKGIFASIYIDNVSSLTEEQISSIKNIDNVIFKLPDGVDMDISQLLNARLNISGKTISGTTNVSMDLDSQIARANEITNKNGGGGLASIVIDNVNSLTESQINSIKNKDCVVFRLSDGSSMNIFQLLEERSYILNKPISEMIKTFKDINVQIKEANIRIKSGDTALIDVSDVTVLTEEVLSKIENVDDVTFRMPDGSTFKIDDVRTIRDKFNKVRYRKKVHFAINEILKKANPKLVELYDMGKKTGRGILGFRGYEEHNYLHVVRVANESVSILKKFNSILDGTANGIKLEDRLKISQYYGKISEDIIYYAGLAHDLGMILRTYSKYKLKTIDAEGIVRQEFQKVGEDTIETKLYEKVFNTLISDVIRKNHALGSAIIVLKENLFGTNNEMISVLAALHSKSSSGVKDLLNENAVKDVILDLYNNRENCGYNFDISKFGTLTEVVNSDGTIKQVFDIDNEVLKQIRTGTYALRLGDAHAEKTGFNHGGGMFKIDKVPLPLSENSYVDVKEFDKICFNEIKDAAVSVEYLDDGTIQVISGDIDVSGDRGFEFSKRVIFGERNVYPVQTEVRDGHMVYIQEVKTTNTPACTVEHGIIEKFGEYNTATGIPQDVLVVLPEDTPEYIFRYYRKRLAVAKALKYGNINKIEIKWQNEIYPADLDKN